MSLNIKRTNETKKGRSRAGKIQKEEESISQGKSNSHYNLPIVFRAAGLGICLGLVILACIVLLQEKTGIEEQEELNSRYQIAQTGGGSEDVGTAMSHEEILELYTPVLVEYQKGAQENFAAYSPYVAEYFSKSTYYHKGPVYYAFYDFCHDGIPELLIADYAENTDSYLIEDVWGSDGSILYRMVGLSYKKGPGDYVICEGNVLRSSWAQGMRGGYDFYQLFSESPTADWITSIETQSTAAELTCYRLLEENADQAQYKEIAEEEFQDILNQYPENKELASAYSWNLLFQYDKNTQTEEKTNEKPEQTSEPENMVAIQYNLTAPVSDFMFPYSSQQELTQEQLDSMLRTDIEEMRSESQMAINEILARYGFTFGDGSRTAQEAAAYFSNKTWYQQAQNYCSYTDPNELIASMTEVEKSNIDLIIAWQLQHIPY